MKTAVRKPHFEVTYYFKDSPRDIKQGRISVGVYDPDNATKEEQAIDDCTFFWVENPYEVINLLGDNSKEDFVVTYITPCITAEDGMIEEHDEDIITIDTLWLFIGEHYPNYSSCNEIAYADDLQKIMDEELTGEALELWEGKFESDIEKVKVEYELVNNSIYKKTFEYYYKEEEVVKSLKQGLVTMQGIYHKIQTFFIQEVSTETLESSDLYEELAATDYTSLPVSNSDVKQTYFNRLKFLTELKMWLVEYYSSKEAVKVIVEDMAQFESNTFTEKWSMNRNKKKVKVEASLIDKEDHLKVLSRLS